MVHFSAHFRVKSFTKPTWPIGPRLVRALVDVVWKPREIKSLLALSVKCVRANLDKLKPLVPVLPHELQQRINPLEVKVHDSTCLPSLSILPPMFSRTDAPRAHTERCDTASALGVTDQKLWWSRPHDAATHCLNILVTTYRHCFTELAKIVDEYLEPEQPWRKRYRTTARHRASPLVMTIVTNRVTPRAGRSVSFCCSVREMKGTTTSAMRSRWRNS